MEYLDDVNKTISERNN